MPMPNADRLCVLRFAATFLWADLHVDHAERAFFLALARELGATPDALPAIADMLVSPPDPEAVDPTRVSPRLAATVRAAALRAIASDGWVAQREMALFDLLDELLPRAPPAARGPGAEAAPQMGS
jgi:hypothetical protein